MGCLKSIAYQIGCLLVMIALAIGAFIYREQVVALYHKLRGTPARAETVYVMPGPDSKREADQRIAQLTRRGGPAYVDLEADHVAALLQDAIGRTGSRGLDSIQVGLMDDEIRVKGSLDLTRVPRDLLGPLRNMVGEREPVIIGGGVASDTAGRMMIDVTTLRVADFPFPRATIARLLREARIPGLEGSRVVLPAIDGIGDVRVSPDGLRIYRSAPR